MNNFFDKVGILAKKALYAELETTPKYGLVCPDTNGSHSDMDFAVMKKGIDALTPFFGKFAQIGFEAKEANGDLLYAARSVGIKAEKAMFCATNGINTHKGALFCLGLVCVAVGFAKKRDKRLSAKAVCGIVAKMCEGICKRELKMPSDLKEKTHGQKVFEKYGATGARGLAQNGYGEVTKIYLPTLKRLYAKTDANTAQSRLLALIVSRTEDVNILFRSDAKTLKDARLRCKNLYRKYKKEEAAKTNEWFVSQNISAGGSADLLSLTIFLYELSGLDRETDEAR